MIDGSRVRGRAGIATVIAASAVALLVASACSSSSSGSKKSTPADSSTAGSAPASGTSAPASGTSPAVPTASGLSTPKQTYVSLGDSYAAGYQPKTSQTGATTRNGYAYQVVSQAAAKGYDFNLVNFGCSGATTTSAISTPGCKAANLGPGAPTYTKTQAAAAEDYLKAHRGKVGLVTVALGGNDITSCATASNAVTCVSAALAKLTTNLTTLVSGLRAAAGPQTRIVGITYPDVFLGDLLSTDAAKRDTANLSVLAFRSLINPALTKVYGSVGVSLVDVTTATGAYGSLDQKTTLPPYGSIPVPVAKICQLTYYCQLQDIHPRTVGYALIAKLVVGTLPKL